MCFAGAFASRREGRVPADVGRHVSGTNRSTSDIDTGVLRGGKLDAADPSRWGQDAIAKNVNSTRLAIVHRLTAGLVWPSVG